MTPDAPSTPPSTPPSLATALRRLRGGLRAWLALSGAARLAGAVVACAAVSFALDRLFRLDVPQRLFCLVAAVGLLAWLAWRHLIAPLRARLVDAQLSRRIEHAHPELREDLTAALGLSRRGDPAVLGWSPALVASTLHRAETALAAVDPLAALDRERRRRHLLALAAAIGVALVAALAAPATLGLWLRRNLLLSSEAWPCATTLDIAGAVDGRLRLPRGDDLDLEVGVRGVVPPALTVAWELAGEDGEATLVKVGERAFRWSLPGVNAALRLRVRGGDGDTGWVAVELVPRPEATGLALEWTPPAYAGLPARKLPPGDASHRLLAGGRLAVSGQASVDLVGVELHRGQERVATTPASARTFAISLAGKDLASGDHRLALIGADGLRSPAAARFALTVVPDREPTVRVRPEGIGDLITTRALIPLRLVVQDDLAVTAVAVVRESEVNGSTAGEAQPDAGGQKAATGSQPAAASGQRFAVTDLKPWAHDRPVEHLHRLDAQPLGLAVDGSLVLRVEATDNDAVAGPKTGRSTPLVLRVVSDEALRAELLRREQEQRQEFERLIKRQETLIADTAGQRGGDASPARRDAVRELEKRQRLIARGGEGVAEQFARIAAELVNNRLEDPSGAALRRVAEGIIAPLRSLAAGTQDEAGAALARAAAAGDEPARSAAIAAAEAAERRALAEMRRILAGMVKWEGYQEAVALLQDVVRGQEDVQRATQEAQKKLIEKIFGP